MGRKRKAFAVMVPALVLVASAAEMPPAGASALRVDGRTVLAADPSAPPDGQGDGQMPGMPGMDGGQTSDPSQTAAPPDPSAPPQTADPSQTAAPDPTDSGSPDPTQSAPGQQNGNGQNQSQVKAGPRADQFADIRTAPRVRQPRSAGGGSTGLFTSSCGTNAGQKHSNPDNVIVAPGVQNGAHHIHDYVGNLDTSAFSTDQTLAAAGTTCTNGDQSTYYWPVVRLRAGQDGSDRAAQSQVDGNTGSVVTPAKVTIQFRGNPRSKVTAIPRFTRIVTGDAKAATNGPANAHSQWTCSGFENRAFTDKYPLCPKGSRVERVLNFPSCWDGQNTDSANHRDHMVFPDQRTGQCPQGRKAVPQLRMTLAYNLPAKALAFALDTFPEQGHDPVTDHGDFINVMTDQLMQKAVTAVNGRRR
jgi:hypothetical protein